MPDLIGTDDARAADAARGLETAAVQAAGADGWSQDRLTSPAVQAGVDRPDLGVPFDDTGCTGAEVVSMNRIIQPNIEAQIAFVVGRDITEDHLDEVSVRSAVDHAIAALEIVDNRITGRGHDPR